MYQTTNTSIIVIIIAQDGVVWIWTGRPVNATCLLVGQNVLRGETQSLLRLDWEIKRNLKKEMEL